MTARTEVNVNGVFYDDIDWNKPIHKLPETCPICTGDIGTGHQNACPYMWSEMETPNGRHFLESMIREALEKEAAEKEAGA